MGAMTRTAVRQGADVLASAAAGDEIAFRRIIAAHHEDMRRVCAYIAGDLTIAEDATQAAWAIAWRRLRDVREPSHLRPWLMRVAANEAKQLLRKRRNRTRRPAFGVVVRGVLYRGDLPASVTDGRLPQVSDPVAGE